MKKRDKFKPAVTKNVMILLAGLLWACVGIMLLLLALSWLSAFSQINRYLFLCAGVVVALFFHHFVFLKIVDKNLARLLPIIEKKCLFYFLPFKSYFIILVMIALGSILRHSAIPKQYLAIIYAGIGIALILSSVRYGRFFINEIKR